MEQIRHTSFNIVQEKVEALDSRFQKYEELMQTVLDKTDRNTHEAFSTISKIISEQADVRRHHTWSEGATEAAMQEESEWLCSWK